MAQLLPSDLVEGLQRTMLMNPAEYQKRLADIKSTQAITRNYGLEGDRMAAELPYMADKARLANNLTGVQIPGVESTTAHNQALTDASNFALANRRYSRNMLMKELGKDENGNDLPPEQPAPPPPPYEPTPESKINTGVDLSAPFNPSSDIMSRLIDARNAAPSENAGNAIMEMMGKSGVAPAQVTDEVGSSGKNVEELMRRTAIAKALGADDPLATYTEGQQGIAVKAMNEQLINRLSSPEWRNKIMSIGWNRNKGMALFNEFRAQNPGFSLLPEPQQKLIETSFGPNQQTSMGSIFLDQSREARGIGFSLAEEVAAGRLKSHEAVNSVLTNRFLGAKAKVDELKNLSSRVPELGEGYTMPQLDVFAKNAANPTFNSQIGAIDAVTPNIEMLIKLSDANGRTNLPALNKAIQAGQFQAGDQTITSMEQLQKIIAEESGRVFGGSAVSDFKIKLGDQMVDISIGNDNFVNNARQLQVAMFNKKRALANLMGPYSPWKNEPGMEGGHGKPPGAGGNPNAKAPASGAKGALTVEEAHWYMDQAGGNKTKAMAKAKADGRTF